MSELRCVVCNRTFKEIREGWVEFISAMFRKSVCNVVDLKHPKTSAIGDRAHLGDAEDLMLQFYNDTMTAFGALVCEWVFMKVRFVSKEGEDLLLLPTMEG